MTYFRKDLPQITETLLRAKGLDYEHLTIRPWCISPIQRDRLPQTEERYLRVARNSYKPLIIDRNYNLIDGHHRLDLLLSLNHKDARVIRVALTIEEILEVFQK